MTLSLTVLKKYFKVSLCEGIFSDSFIVIVKEKAVIFQ